MHQRLHKALALLLFLTAAVSSLKAQESDKVWLLSAKSAQLIEKDGQNFRKVVGPAKFLHNNTYLLCDTALWNVNTNIIDAMGNVRIIQDRTRLTSATLQYVVDENMARFRGNLVQLEDQDKNTLRTRYLDYNTKDSVAIFQNGAAMRDKDGQIIESLYGTYDSKAHLFVFNDQVNMYMDTTFVKTSRLEYRSDLSTAYFGYATDMWQDDKMLSANDGWYDRSRELFFFRRNVHLLTESQETWSDTLYYHRAVNDVEMLGNVELMDTTRNVYALAGRFEYTDSLSQVRMTREPAVMSVDRKGRQNDTLYIGGDLLVYRGIKRCDIPEAWNKDAAKRLSDISGDPVMEYRKKAAEAAAKAAEEAAKNDPNRPPTQAAGKTQAPPKGELPPTDSLTVTPPADSLTVQPPADSLKQSPSTKPTTPSTPADSVATPAKDTTKVNFIWASKRVRLFRRDMQMASDSLTYTDLDSLVRLYQDPIVFNEGNRQYTSDSIYAVIRNKAVEKAHLLSNAFITIQEDPMSFDQIRGTEMVAYFDSTAALTRFDALGGATSLFFLEEKGALATVNKVESKMIYTTFKDGQIERMYYYDNPKNDGYPTVQLPQEERQIKGFRWEPERRPKSPLDVTSLVPRPSQRTAYLDRPHAKFTQTDIYFPGHINKVYRDIAIRDSLQVARDLAYQRQRDSLSRIPADTLKVAADSLSAASPKLAEGKTEPAKQPADTLSSSVSTAPADSLSAAPASVPSKEELRAARKAARQAAREERWARQDRIYEQKQAAKAARKLEKERAKKLKALKKLERRAQKERKVFERYLKKYQKKNNKTP